MRSGRKCLILAACVMAAAVAAHAASTSFWLVSTQTDFLKGEVEQLSVDSDGRVMLGPAVDTLHQTSTPAVWRLALDSEGAVWAGTGNEGKLIKVDSGGKASVVFDATELEIHAIAPAAGGVVYAGSSPDGKVYKITKDGKSTPFFDPEDKYIWTLLAAPDGTLYAGTGEKGRVYKIGADGTGKVFYESGTTHVTSLAWDGAKDGKSALLVGTSSPGRVVRVDPATGRGFVLLESAYKEIRSIRVSSAGTIFATAVGAGSESSSAPEKPSSTIDTTSTPIASVSTEVTITAIGDQTIVTPSSGGSSRGESRSGSAKGAVYRIAPDGDWDEFWTSNDDAPYDVLIEPNGSLLVATGDKGKIYRISGDPTVSTLVTRAVSQQVTSFAQDAQGRVYYATSNPGRILRVTTGQAEKGTYLSDVKDTQTVSTWGAIRWRAVTPSGTSVELFTRSGNTKTPDSTWSDWSKAYTNAMGEPIASPKARYLQWRAVLAGSGKATPVLTSVTSAYLPRNARPSIASITVHPPGTVFQRPFPTGDPELAGFETSTSDGRAPNPGSSSSASSSAGVPLGRRTYQKSLQTFAWRADDGDEDKLQFDVYFRREGETDWKVLRRGLWDGIYTWDTTSVPDGTYVIKVMASDAPSNSPAGALTAERESATFEIDNTPPTIDVRPTGQTASAANATFVVRDSHSPIQRVEYSTSAGGWKLLYPVDGLLDAREERFELARDPASTEPIVLRAIDTLSNVATAVLPAPSAKPAPAAAPRR
jgi:sugar lactone lactonase YvrE